MHEQFDGSRYDLVPETRVHIAGMRYSRSRLGELDVWIERDASGERFIRQSTVDGCVSGVGTGVYSDECYILKNRATGRYFFLERSARGFYLQSDDFFGADMYAGAEAALVADWLSGRQGGARA